MGGLAGAGLLVAVGALGLEPLWRAFAGWRAAGFVSAGFTDWQAGRWREAELDFKSATALDAKNLRAWQLLARMYLQQGRVAEARNIFSRMLAAAPDDQSRRTTAELYLDSLIGTGSFAEAAEFAAWEYSRAPTPAGTNWAAAAFHAARLARLPAGWAGRQADPRVEPAVLALQSLGAAYAATGSADACAHLASAAATQLGWPLRVAGARLALALGDTARARIMLIAGPGGAEGAEDLGTAIMLGRHTAPELRRLAAQVFPAGLDEGSLITRLGALLPFESGELPEIIAATGNFQRRKLGADSLGALWLLWELNRPGRRDNPWTEALGEKIYLTPLGLVGSRLTPTQFVGLINSLPLSRDTVLSLMSRVDPPAAAVLPGAPLNSAGK